MVYVILSKFQYTSQRDRKMEELQGIEAQSQYTSQAAVLTKDDTTSLPIPTLSSW